MATKRNDKSAAQAVYRKFKKDLSQGTIGSLYIFHGEEAYLRDYYLDQMKAKLIPGGMESFNYHLLPGKGLTAQRLGETVDALPMMSPRTLIVVNDYDLFKAPEGERTAMTKILSDLPEYCCLVFVYDTVPYKSDARMRKLTGAIQEKGQVVQFARQQQGDLVDWIGRRFRALGHEIDTADAQYLIFLCGDLMNGLISEIGKIGAFAKNRRVTRQDIDAVAIPVIDAKVFEMTDALGRRQMDQAFATLGDLFQLRQEPIMILAVLGKHFRQLYTARVALEARQSSRWLMELWGMRSTYPADKLMDMARRHGLDWCRMAMRDGPGHEIRGRGGPERSAGLPDAGAGRRRESMLKIQEAIVVEGRYDKNTLSQVVDAVILETSGFGIFKDKEKLALLRRVGEKRGLILLTDSDGAGFVIRNYLKGALPKDQVKQAYIPDRPGKEKRKKHPGKEGKLGVEGMSPAVLEQALRQAGATILDGGDEAPKAPPLTKADLFAWGLSGGPGSKEKRQALLQALDLPAHLSPNAMLPVLSALYDRQALLETIKKL